MEKQLSTDEARLFDLIESYDYAHLNEVDKQFVDLHISQEDYLLQRKIICSSDDLFQFDQEARKLETLMIYKPKAGKVIPLYQAILAVASVVIVFVVIWPRETSNKQVAEINQFNPVETTKLVHDTIIQYVPQVKYLEKKIVETKIEYLTEYKTLSEEPRLLEVAQTLNLPILSKDLIENKGSTLKEDQSSRFILPTLVSR